MKKLKIIILVFILPWIWHTIQAQQSNEAPDKKEQAKEDFTFQHSPFTFNQGFTNPTVPGTLILENYEGDIDITGYTGREVLVEARLQSKNNNLAGFGYLGRPFTIEEKHNTMVIRAKQINYGEVPHINFKIKVPEKTTLKVKILKKGNLETRKTSRLVEVDNQNGSVQLHDLQGWAVVNAVNGDIKADFDEVITNKAMSFVSLNGGIYLDLPKNTKANFKMKSTSGIILNEFDNPSLLLEQTSLNENNLNRRNQGANIYRPNEYNQEIQKEEELSEVVVTGLEADKKQNKSYKAVLGRKKKQSKKEKNPKPTPSNAQVPQDSMPPPNVQNSSRKVYLAPMSFEAQANGGGPIFFISARNGEIKVIKNKKK